MVAEDYRAANTFFEKLLTFFWIFKNYTYLCNRTEEQVESFETLWEDRVKR